MISYMISCSATFQMEALYLSRSGGTLKRLARTLRRQCHKDSASSTCDAILWAKWELQPLRSRPPVSAESPETRLHGTVTGMGRMTVQHWRLSSEEEGAHGALALDLDRAPCLQHDLGVIHMHIEGQIG